jgi:F-box/leucine-rich repeat protein 10/11
MTVREYLREYEGKPGHNALNVIDFDVGHLSMFTLPDCVKESSLAHSVCPELPEHMDPRYGVSSYLLLSEGGSLTEFHQDFSATSSFCFVLKGKKIFYFVLPTAKNVDMYKEWSRDDNSDW